MEKIRCGWCEKDDLYRKYHDEEWGRPVYDDETIFEFLILESFQAGLSGILFYPKGKTSGKLLIILIIKKLPLIQRRRSKN